MTKTLILGLGNPILTDDGVGVRVAEAVRATLPSDASVEVGEASVGGLGLMERLLGYEKVILIDALHSGRHAPGVCRRLSLDDLRSLSPTQHSASAHDTSLVTALEMGQQMGLSLPEEVIIYAIEVENITDFGEEPTPAVAQAIPVVTAAVLSELKEFGRLEGWKIGEESRFPSLPSFQVSKKPGGTMISLELLRRYPVFAGLSRDQIGAMAKLSSELIVEADHYFFREGDHLHGLYLIVEGAAAIIIEVPDQDVEYKLSEKLSGALQTRDVVISAVGPGELFGWSALVPPHKAMASGKAITACRIVTFDCQELHQAFEDDCRFGYLMMQKAAQSYRDQLRAMRIESLAHVAG